MISLWKDWEGNWHRKGIATGALLYGVMYTEPHVDLDATLAEVYALIPRDIHWVGIKQTGCRPGIVVDVEIWTPMVRSDLHRRFSVGPLQVEARKNEKALPASVKDFIDTHIRHKVANHTTILKQHPEVAKLIIALRNLAIIDIDQRKRIRHFEIFNTTNLSSGMRCIATICDRRIIRRGMLVQVAQIKSMHDKFLDPFLEYGVIEREKQGNESVFIWRGYDNKIRRRILKDGRMAN